MDQAEQTISGETKPVVCPVAETKTESVSAVTQSVHVEAKTETVGGNPEDIQPEDKEAKQDEYVPVVVRKEPGGGSNSSIKNTNMYRVIRNTGLKNDKSLETTKND